MAADQPPTFLAVECSIVDRISLSFIYSRSSNQAMKICTTMKLSVSFLALLPLAAAVQTQDNATARKLKGSSSKNCDPILSGNGICDPENNDKDCGYDGGDCLIFQRSAFQEDLLQQYPELMAYNHGDYHGLKLADGKEIINCNRLTQCEWPGKQDSWLGDGTCDEDTVRNYFMYLLILPYSA